MGTRLCCDKTLKFEDFEDILENMDPKDHERLEIRTYSDK